LAKTSNPLDRFELASAEEKPRLVGLSIGDVGARKTSFWLGGPGPVVVQTLDQGLEGVVGRYVRAGKEVRVANYDLGYTTDEYTQELAVEARDKFEADFDVAVKNCRTLIWDRESDMYDLFVYAEFGAKERADQFSAAPPRDWDKLKGRIRRMIAIAKAHDVNFGIIQGLRDE